MRYCPHRVQINGQVCTPRVCKYGSYLLSLHQTSGDNKVLSPRKRIVLAISHVYKLQFVFLIIRTGVPHQFLLVHWAPLIVYTADVGDTRIKDTNGLLVTNNPSYQV